MVERCLCNNDLSPVGLEHVDFFLTHFVRNGEDAAIPTYGGGHRKSQSGVAGRAFDNRAARFKQSSFLSLLDHIDRHPVFYRA